MLSLRGQVDTGQIRARQEDGVLIVTLPKTPEAQQPAQEIKVE
jgi:HSP20 family protein